MKECLLTSTRNKKKLELLYINSVPSIFIITNGAGRGVFTTKSFQRGDFLLQYKGKFHSTFPGNGSYIFEANSGNHTFWYVINVM